MAQAPSADMCCRTVGLSKQRCVVRLPGVSARSLELMCLFDSSLLRGAAGSALAYIYGRESSLFTIVYEKVY